MGFRDFLGNSNAVLHLRESLAAGRLPHALLLSGSKGVGKYTLALMMAQAANCLREPFAEDGLPDFCGSCSNCIRINAAGDLSARVSEAIATREEMRDADKKDTRIMIQTHPDVLIIPPDPPQLLIKMGQVRSVIREIYRVPSEARRAFYIFTGSAFMKEAANSLLKVLEEPPAHATLLLLTSNPQELLPTIRSRTAAVRLSGLTVDEMEKLLLARRPELKPVERALISQLADGAPGAALGFDLPTYLDSRTRALTLLRNALGEPDYSALFRMTEAYRAGAEGQEKTSALLMALHLLLRDLMVMKHGQTLLVRNVDLERQLHAMAESVEFSWIEASVRSIDEVQTGMRRNLLRSLSLDAMAGSLSATFSKA
jgi:DNA polymerase-3 subunit delta'